VTSVAVRILEDEGLGQHGVGEALERHARALESGEGVLKDGRRTAVTRVCVDGHELVVKEYLRPRPADGLRDRLGASRGVRAWRAARLLVERGIATPEPVALVELDGRRHLLTRFVPAAIPLDRLLRERFAKGVELAAKRDLARTLGRWLRGVHAQGIYHGDCSAKNVLAVAGEGFGFVLLDLDAVTSTRRLSWRRRVKSLCQLVDPPGNLTRTDRLRVIHAYASGKPELSLRRLHRDVTAAVARRVRRRARHHRRWLRRKETARRRQRAQEPVVSRAPQREDGP
jgi:tRNA A-37 threonylcarbamoyl transferase component Bud32